MADALAARTARTARRRSRRKRAAVLLIAVALVLGGAGTAWALSGSSGAAYRLATVTRATVRQTVDADGALAARDTAALAFAASGTVKSVRVAVGDHVTAGQTLATIDTSDLTAAKTSAQSTLARAQQTLADDEAAQAAGTTSTSSTSSTSATTSSTTTSSGASGFAATTAVRLASAITAVAPSSARSSTTSSAPPTGTTAPPTGTTAPPTGTTSGTTAVSRAQRLVTAAQSALDAAIDAEEADVATLVTNCATGSDAVTTTVVAGGNTVSGAVGSQDSVVTLTGPDASGAQHVNGGGQYSFSGPTTGASYQVRIARTDITDSAACARSATAVGVDQQSVDRSRTALDTALTALTKAVKALGSGTTTGGTGSTTGGTGSKTGGSGTGSKTGGTGSKTAGTGSTTGGSTAGGTQAGGSSTSGAAITAEQIAADEKSIDAAKAALAVAEHNMRLAALTAPISGTVAAVDVATGDTVSDSGSSTAVTVTGSGTLSVTVDVGIADIAKVKIGQSAQVTVDGRPAALPGKVSVVGMTNASTSTGSSASYAVTVDLDKVDAHLYDGMGASVAIDVGAATAAISLPISAVHTLGTRRYVDLYQGGKVTTTFVTAGVEGADRVQITAGLKVGQRVALADMNAALPSSGTSTTTTTGLGGLTGGGFGGAGGGGGFGGAGGGFGGAGGTGRTGG